VSLNVADLHGEGYLLMEQTGPRSRAIRRAGTRRGGKLAAGGHNAQILSELNPARNVPRV